MHPKSPKAPIKENKRSFEVPLFIRRSMEFLKLLHWKLALMYALKLFFSPLKFTIPKREINIRNQAKRIIIPLGAREASLFEWGEGPNKVIIMHGWSGRASQFFRLIEILVKNGYHVYSIEAPAHGSSHYKQTDMLEFVRAIQWTLDEFGPIQTAIGHSLGGMALFNAHHRMNGAFRKLITIGSPASIRGVVRDFCEVVNAGERVAEGIIDSIQKSFALKVEDVSTDTLAAKWNPPGLIFHDEDDADVGVENARKLSKVWPAAELHISTGLGHRRILSEPSVHQSILSFIGD